MAENKQIETIIEELKSNLTGDFEKDKVYLNYKMEEYKDHEHNIEILREIGRLMYSIMPEDVRKKVDDTINSDLSIFDNAIEKAQIFIHDGDLDKAFELTKELVDEYENNGFEFKNDNESEYYCFEEPIEQILYMQFNKPAKEIRRNPYNYALLFYLHGSLLIEKGKIKEAREALLKSRRWNPASTMTLFELAETYKMLGEFDEFCNITKDAYKYIHRKKDLGRYYRNLGYYFVEIKEYETAANCYIFSKVYDKSDLVDQELSYIFSITGEFEPMAKAWAESVEKYDIPLTIHDDFLGITYYLGKECFKDGNNNMAMYYFDMFSEFQEDDEVKEMMEKIVNL